MYDNDTLYFVVKLNLDGAAFEDGQGDELARILRAMADDVGEKPIAVSHYRSVRDENGNNVGTYAIKSGYYLNK